MGIIEHKLLEKTNYFVVCLFVLLTICFSSNLHANNKDIAELEAFYKLVFEKDTIKEIRTKPFSDISQKKSLKKSSQKYQKQTEFIVQNKNKVEDRRDPQLIAFYESVFGKIKDCLLYTSPSPRDKRQSRMPSSA